VEDGICGVTLTTATVEELGYGSEISPTPTVADDLGLYAFFSKYLKYQIIFLSLSVVMICCLKSSKFRRKLIVGKKESNLARLLIEIILTQYLSILIFW